MNVLQNYFLKRFNEYHFILFWFLLNFFQIATTELTSDEGYYWFYSQHLAWGFYDHPPLLAFLIKLGGFFFASEIGVRFCSVVLLSFAIYLLFKIKYWTRFEKRVLALLILAFPLLNYITFIAFPDSPLVAISMFILFVYKKFLEKETLQKALVLGGLVALLFYAKYHALLFVFFIIISNFKLLNSKYFFTALITFLVLLIPHFLWQYQHDFASFKFHTSGRATNFQLRFLGEFLSQQLIILSPALIFIPFIVKAKNQFEKTLQFIAIGTLVFFLVSSVRGFVHLHWTSIAIFPILILATQFYSAKNQKKVLLLMAVPFVLLLFVIRFYLSFHIFPVNGIGTDYYHERNLWATDINEIAQERPVVFEAGNESLREAPLLQFYGNKKSIALFPSEYKKSQYQILQYEDSMQQKDILLIRNKPFKSSTQLKTDMGKIIHYKLVDDFNSFQNAEIIVGKIEVTADKIIAQLKIKNHRNIPIKLSTDIIFLKTKKQKIINNENTSLITIQSKTSKTIYFIAKNPKLKNNTNLKFGFKNEFIDWSINSETIEINISN